MFTHEHNRRSDRDERGEIAALRGSPMPQMMRRDRLAGFGQRLGANQQTRPEA